MGAAEALGDPQKTALEVAEEHLTEVMGVEVVHRIAGGEGEAAVHCLREVEVLDEYWQEAMAVRVMTVLMGSSVVVEGEEGHSVVERRERMNWKCLLQEVEVEPDLELELQAGLDFFL